MLKEELLLPMNISAKVLATAIGVPSLRILDIIHARRGVTVDTTARIARFFGTTERFWLNLQTEYDLLEVRQKKQTEIERIVPYANTIICAEI